MKIHVIKLQPYQVECFQQAVEKFNKTFRNYKATVSFKELPLDDDGFVFFDVIIAMERTNPKLSASEETGLLYLGKIWGSLEN